LVLGCDRCPFVIVWGDVVDEVVEGLPSERKIDVLELGLELLELGALLPLVGPFVEYPGRDHNDKKPGGFLDADQVEGD